MLPVNLSKKVSRALAIGAAALMAISPFVVTASPVGATGSKAAPSYQCTPPAHLYSHTCTTVTYAAPTSAITQSCPSGTLSNGVCTETFTAVPKYPCLAISKGTYSNGNCTLTFTPQTSATCATGVFMINKCVITTSVPATESKKS